MLVEIVISWIGFITVICSAVNVSGNSIREWSIDYCYVCKPAAFWADCAYQSCCITVNFSSDFFHMEQLVWYFSVLFCQENVRLVLLSVGHCASRSPVEFKKALSPELFDSVSSPGPITVLLILMFLPAAIPSVNTY